MEKQGQRSASRSSRRAPPVAKVSAAPAVPPPTSPPVAKAGAAPAALPPTSPPAAKAADPPSKSSPASGPAGANAAKAADPVPKAPALPIAKAVDAKAKAAAAKAAGPVVRSAASSHLCPCAQDVLPAEVSQLAKACARYDNFPAHLRQPARSKATQPSQVTYCKQWARGRRTGFEERRAEFTPDTMCPETRAKWSTYRRDTVAVPMRFSKASGLVRVITETTTLVTHVYDHNRVRAALAAGRPGPGPGPGAAPKADGCAAPNAKAGGQLTSGSDTDGSSSDDDSSAARSAAPASQDTIKSVGKDGKDGKDGSDGPDDHGGPSGDGSTSCVAVSASGDGSTTF